MTLPRTIADDLDAALRLIGTFAQHAPTCVYRDTNTHIARDCTCGFIEAQRAAFDADQKYKVAQTPDA